MNLRHLGGLGRTRTAQRIATLLVAAFALAAGGCEGLFPVGDTSLDGNWRVIFFPPGDRVGTEFATIVISRGQPQALTGFVVVDERFAALSGVQIPLNGSSLNLLLGAIAITGNSTLAINGDAVTLDVDIAVSLLGQPQGSFSARLNGNVVSDGVIEGTAEITGAFLGADYADPGGSIEFRMVRQ